MSSIKKLFGNEMDKEEIELAKGGITIPVYNMCGAHVRNFKYGSFCDLLTKELLLFREEVYTSESFDAFYGRTTKFFDSEGKLIYKSDYIPRQNAGRISFELPFIRNSQDYGENKIFNGEELK